MDWGLFWQAAGVGVAVLGVIAGGFWRMWALIKDVRDESSLKVEAAHMVSTGIRQELHEHKLAVAENYVSKAGLREVEERIMDGLLGLGAQISGMNGRIDRMLERPARRTTGQS